MSLITNSQLEDTAKRAVIYTGNIAQSALDAIEELSTMKMDKVEVSNATLSASGWTANTDASTAEIFEYVYVLEIENATDNSTADCLVSPTSIPVAISSNICPTVVVSDGKITIYANTQPTEDIEVTIRLYSV